MESTNESFMTAYYTRWRTEASVPEFSYGDRRLPPRWGLLPPFRKRIDDADNERILFVFRFRPLKDIASFKRCLVRPIVTVFRVKRQVFVCDKLRRKREFLQILSREGHEALGIAK